MAIELFCYESLRKSADLYAEIYSEDDDLKELTETAVWMSGMTFNASEL